MAPKDQSLEFIMYRLESLEKRLESMEKRSYDTKSNPDILNILLKLLEKQAIQEPDTPSPPKVTTTTKKEDDIVYDSLLSFARRRTIV